MGSIINKFPAGNNRFLTLTLKRIIFILFEQPGNNLWYFDLEGRPVGMFVDGKNYRRTLNNNLHCKSRSKSRNVRFITEVSDYTFKKLYDRSLNILLELKEYPGGINSYGNLFS